MKVVILKDAAAVAQYGATIFITQISRKPDSVLGAMGISALTNPLRH